MYASIKARFLGSFILETPSDLGAVPVSITVGPVVELRRVNVVNWKRMQLAMGSARSDSLFNWLVEFREVLGQLVSHGCHDSG